MKEINIQHIEFFQRDHFANCYHRVKAFGSIARFIDFFWETDFEHLWQDHPDGFSDLLFPNMGYTYLINLGTPFSMQLNDEVFEIRKNGFLPRNKYITACHSKGNKIFGIKFKVSPVKLKKEVNFGEYKDQIFPLAYLIDKQILLNLKAAADFKTRVKIIADYYEEQIQDHSLKTGKINIVLEILDDLYKVENCTIALRDLAGRYEISNRTLQRYFENVTGNSAKKAEQLIRTRKAITKYIEDPVAFQVKAYGYYDYSHFYRDMMQFFQGHKMANIQSQYELFNTEAYRKQLG